MAGRPSSGYDHAGEIAGYSDESGDMLAADMENEREDEDSVCSPGDLPECRSGPPSLGAPDVTKTQPCARQECWVDPLSLNPQVGGHE